MVYNVGFVLGQAGDAGWLRRRSGSLGYGFPERGGQFCSHSVKVGPDRSLVRRFLQNRESSIPSATPARFQSVKKGLLSLLAFCQVPAVTLNSQAGSL